jgi:hypothetical protein
MTYLSGFNLKASTTAIRAEVNDPPYSVKACLHDPLHTFDFKVLLIAISKPRNKLL